MAESNYLKTVAFGGYDKTDVNNRLNYLYGQIYELKNSLRENKQLLDEYKKGTDEEKAQEAVLSAERAKLTMAQVQNESLTEKLKEARETLKIREKENEELSAKAEELSKQLADANAKVDSLTDGGAASLSKVFIEAQKSADMLVSDAKKQAEELEAGSRVLVENMIIEANNEAARIVYEAEKEAAEKKNEALNDAEQMKVASGNLKAVMFEDVKVISADLQKAKDVFEAALSKVRESEELLEKTTNKLNSEGIPVFKMPETVQLEMPEPPAYQNAAGSKNTASDEDEAAKKRRKEELDRLAAMANSIGEEPIDEADAAKKPSDSHMDMSELLKQAEELNSL